MNEHREVRRRFWQRIAEGLSSEEAAAACGVSQPVGGRWFRQGGGMPPLSLAMSSARYLSFAEREEIALLKAKIVCTPVSITLDTDPAEQADPDGDENPSATDDGDHGRQLTIPGLLIPQPRLTRRNPRSRLSANVKDRGGG